MIIIMMNNIAVRVTKCQLLALYLLKIDITLSAHDFVVLARAHLMEFSCNFL